MQLAARTGPAMQGIHMQEKAPTPTPEPPGQPRPAPPPAPDSPREGLVVWGH